MYCATEGVEWMQVFVLGRRVHPYIDRAQFSRCSITFSQHRRKIEPPQINNECIKKALIQLTRVVRFYLKFNPRCTSRGFTYHSIFLHDTTWMLDVPRVGKRRKNSTKSSVVLSDQTSCANLKKLLCTPSVPKYLTSICPKMDVPIY